MADVITSQPQSVAVAAAPQWGVATRKYAVEAIGAFFLTFAVGGISGGVFNPAVALGGASAGLFAWSTIWIYLLVELGAGIAAGLAFLALNPGDK